MAFNPFHSFRKHQKAILAVVTIILMGVFTLSFAGSPFANNGMFGGAPANSGKEVTTFKYRTNWLSSQTRVWESTVDKEFRQRRLADEFIKFVVNRGTYQAMQEVAPIRDLFAPPDPTKNHYPPILEPIITRRSRRLDQTLARFIPPAPPAQRVIEIRKDLEQVAMLRQNRPIVDKDVDKAEEFEKAATALLAALRFELWATEQQALILERNEKTAPVLFFGGNLSLDDTLDFMLWRHEADKLGVTYNETSVRKGINRMIGVGEAIALNNNFLDNTLVKEFFESRSPRGSKAVISTQEVNDLLAALTDEFRVQTAKEALLGEPSSSTAFTATGIYQPTEGVTPDEFLQFFRENRTVLNTAFLAVPVSYFIDPDKKYSDETLLELFERYRSALPAPDRAEPAFKVPRKVRIEYATGDPTSPYYKEAGKLLMLHPTVLRHSVFASSYNAGGGVLGWLGVTGLPFMYQPFYKDYERYQLEMEDEVRHKQAVSPAVYDRHYQAAVTVGEILGSLQQAGPLAIPTEFAGAAAVDDAAVAQAVGATVLGATSPTPVTLAMLPYPYSHTVQKLAEVESSLIAESEKTLGEQQLRDNLDTLRKELDKLSTTPDKAKQYLEKTTRELGLQINGMSEAKDRYGIVDDPAMKPFKDEYNYLKTQRPNEVSMPLADLLLQINSVYRPHFWSTTIPRGSYVFWLAEDKPAHELPFSEARPQVLAAAQLRDARTLALEFVKKFTSTELKGLSWPEDAKIRTKEMKSFLESQKLGVAQKPGRVFQLDNISRLWTPEMVPNLTSGDRVYYAFSPPESDFPFPPANFVDRVMTMQQPGDSVFMRDRPERNFYVSVLIERSVPTLDDFRKVYASVDGFGQRDPLWDIFMRERRAQFRKDFIRRMREEATGELDEEGRIRVPADFRQKFDKSDAS